MNTSHRFGRLLMACAVTSLLLVSELGFAGEKNGWLGSQLTLQGPGSGVEGFEVGNGNTEQGSGKFLGVIDPEQVKGWERSFDENFFELLGPREGYGLPRTRLEISLVSGKPEVQNREEWEDFSYADIEGLMRELVLSVVRNQLDIMLFKTDRQTMKIKLVGSPTKSKSYQQLYNSFVSSEKL